VHERVERFQESVFFIYSREKLPVLALLERGERDGIKCVIHDRHAPDLVPGDALAQRVLERLTHFFALDRSRMKI
jgi:hypothetical protein